MLNWYEVLKAQNRIPVNDRLTQMFGAVTQEPAWKTIADTLPIEFTSKGGAIHWTVYGKAPHDSTEAGVLPLTFTAKGDTAVDWTIYGNDDNGTENLFDYSQGCDWASGSNGASYQKIIAQQGDVFTVTSSSALYALVRGYDANDAIISGSAWSTGGTSTYTAPASIAYVKVVFRNFEYSTITAEQKATINETMLVKGSTAPDHYIPYQQGVGENTEITGELPIDFRSNGDDLLGYKIYGTADEAGVQTENLFDTQIEQGTMSANGEAPATNRVRYDTSVAVEANTYYSQDATPIDDSKTLEFIAFGFDGSIWISLFSGWKPLDTNFYTNSCRLVRMVYRFSDNADISPSDVTNIMLVKGSTAPTTYIPYGYELPIEITSGTERKDTDIYIGDSKLGEAEYVDYGEQKIYRRILFMTYNDKHFITKDNKDFCLRRRGYSG